MLTRSGHRVGLQSVLVAALVAAATATSALGQAAAKPRTSSDDEAAIRASAEAYQKAFNKGDAKALAAALIQLLSQQDRAMAMGARGQERARALFDERTVLDRQIVAYRRLLGAQLHDAPLPA